MNELPDEIQASLGASIPFPSRLGSAEDKISPGSPPQ